jgi:hypothetical protein
MRRRLFASSLHLKTLPDYFRIHPQVFAPLKLVVSEAEAVVACGVIGDNGDGGDNQMTLMGHVRVLFNGPGCWAVLEVL